MTLLGNITEQAAAQLSDFIYGVRDLAGTPSDFRISLQNVLTSLSVALKNTAQTFTKTQSVQTVVLTDGPSIAIDGSLSNVFRVTLGGNRAIANPTNLVDGATYLFMLVQDATGSRTVTWGTNYEFGSDGTPALTATANRMDVLSFVSNGSNLFFCGIKKGFTI